MLKKILLKPHLVAFLAFGISLFYLLASGVFFRIYGLHKDDAKLQFEIQNISKSTSKIKKNLQQLKEPGFIEREALNRFDLAGKNDLVFIFPE